MKTRLMIVAYQNSMQFAEDKTKLKKNYWYTILDAEDFLIVEWRRKYEARKNYK